MRKIRAIALLGTVAALGCAAATPAQDPAAPETPAPTADEAPKSSEPAPEPNASAGEEAPVGASSEPGSSLTEVKSAEKKKDDDGFATVDAAEAALRDAVSQLETWDKQRRKSTDVKAGTAPAKPRAMAAEETRCEHACKAFSSLKRAAAGVCRIAGESDARCTKARAVVKSNETRVASCKCDEERR